MGKKFVLINLREFEKIILSSSLLFLESEKLLALHQAI